MAAVYAVRHKTRPDERYAVKVLRKEFQSRAERATYLQEAQLANVLPRHGNIVTYFRAWQDAQVWAGMRCARAPASQHGCPPVHDRAAVTRASWTPPGLGAPHTRRCSTPVC